MVITPSPSGFTTEPVTVAVSVTDVPNVEGLLLLVTAMVVLSGLIVCATAELVLPLYDGEPEVVPL
jgi:hypothetical protein